MGTYKPLFMYVAPASIPQIVAHIQKYLEENPILSDPEAIAEAIRDYIEEHPELISVASVNGKTGAVVLTGEDININASSAVTVETQLLNLASMIASAGSNISQIQAQLETIYTNINTLDGKVTANETAIDNLETSVSGQGTRLAAAENDINSLETAQAAQNTRLNAAEGNISSIQTRLAAAETEQTAQGTRINSAEGNISLIQTKVEQIENEMPKILHFDAEITVVPNTNFNTINFESFGVDRNQIISLVLLYTEAVYYDIPNISLGTEENLIYVKLANNVTVNRVYKVRVFYLG